MDFHIFSTCNEHKKYNHDSTISNVLKMEEKVETGNLNIPHSNDILPGDLYFLLHFQILNNIILRKISLNVKIGHPT